MRVRSYLWDRFGPIQDAFSNDHCWFLRGPDRAADTVHFAQNTPGKRSLFRSGVVDVRGVLCFPWVSLFPTRDLVDPQYSGLEL